LEDELLKSSTKVFNHAVEKGSSIIFDSIGVGAHAGSKFKELNESRSLEIVYEPFNAGGAVYDPDEAYMKLPHVTITNREHFSNVKAQMWDRVATRFRKTYEVIAFGANHPHDELISISSEHIPKKTLDKLKIELASPHKDIDGMGKFKVESKKDMRVSHAHSPVSIIRSSHAQRARYMIRYCSCAPMLAYRGYWRINQLSMLLKWLIASRTMLQISRYASARSDFSIGSACVSKAALFASMQM
jgi:phage terminase large subunit